jgi:predicted ribosome quality control (RQC) complex YloA/Tae2 family protein
MVQLSAFEVRHLVGELQDLVGAKIEKIFQQEKPLDDFLFQLHKPGSGKTHIFVSLPGIICQSSFKPVFPDNPPSFCSALRRKISGARIQAITQHNFERIIEFTLSTKHGESTLLIELFSSGNIILFVDRKKILSVLHPKVYSQERKLLPGQTYAYPQAQTNPYLFSQESFIQFIHQTQKDSIVTFLAVDCSLGGNYAQEVVALANIDKDKDPHQLAESEQQILFNALKTVLSYETKAFQISGEKISPIPLQSEQAQALDLSFNELVAQVALAELEEAEDKSFSKEKKESLTKFAKVLRSQEQQLQGLQISEKENQAKGELIYTHYQEVQTILHTISQLRKTNSWKEIKEALKDNPLVDSLDEYKGLVTVELE